MKIICLNEKMKHLIDADELPKNAVIVDIGASAGEFIDSISVLPDFNTFQIYAFEPSKSNMKNLRALKTKKAWENINFFQNAVVGSSDRIVEFTDFIGKNGKFHQWSNIYGRNIDAVKKHCYYKELLRIEKYDVKGISFSKIREIIGHDHIDYLKIDAEGAEKEFFSNNLELSYVKQMSIEWHYDESSMFKLMHELRKMKFSYVSSWKNEIYAKV